MKHGRNDRFVQTDVEGEAFRTAVEFPYRHSADHGYHCTDFDGNWYGPDGNLEKNLVRSQGLNDVAVDRDGNIYVIEATMYHGAHQRRYAKMDGPLPFSYLTEQQANLDPKTQWNKRFSLTARLMKFSPEGGVRDGEGGRPQLWDYAGVSGLSPQGCGTECPAGQICLDPDERIWVPDTFMYCIKAIDKAGNEITRVGKYGNEDCSGGGNWLGLILWREVREPDRFGSPLNGPHNEVRNGAPFVRRRTFDQLLLLWRDPSL